MNQKVLKTLEYFKIIDKLQEQADSFLGKEYSKKLLPSNDINEIRKMQAETSDALKRIMKKGKLSFSGLKDIRSSIKRLAIGSTLGIEELLNIGSVLNVTLRAKTYSRKENEEEKNDSLDEYFSLLEPLTPLNNEIKRCIISEEEISDDASPALRTIRRSIKNTNDKIREQLNSIINSSSQRTMLQENIITMRNGRYCIPVKSEYRSSFQGMIHDQSSSGSTLFIEPISVVKSNNDLKELAIKEQEEIERILAELSNLAGLEVENIDYNLKTLVELDFIFAKAALSKVLRGSEPDFNKNGYINIKKGRHPLIDSKKVVPIDIQLGKDFNLLVITGPNTGGKTVSLKTVGLFTLMGQAGLHIPAFDHSELAVFDEVYADIGDEQSIEQSLSTFSSHMTNTISIVEQANDRSLVLFDELGAGTDPTEGAALAMSILSYLHDKNVRTMATTHYSELKVFALSTKGVTNGSCEFDVESLRPTYRLLIGIPGKSNAFAISGKLGLPDFIIEDAKKRIDRQDKNFEDVISDLESSRITIEKEREEVLRYKEKIEKLKEQLKQKNEKLDSAKERILRQANEEARDILQEAKDFADETIKKYNKWSKEGGLNKAMENERNSLRDKLSGAESKLSLKGNKKPSKVHKPKDFKLGDSVNVLTLGLKGTVSSLPNEKGDLFVQMGILRSQVNIKDLELIDEEVIKGPNLTRTGSGKIKMSKSMSISPEINLIGKTVDEALPELDKYLDDAYLSHLPRVSVIHGIGTGALKNAVHGHLKKTKYVKEYRLGAFGEGGAGVTIVEFKS
ncbi:DNA mismatch repair protein MutS2 [Mobilisporobacter senegalensis]|uniref:Endonuclease MutS2 n=1 Tax=Mobilisporobacter senegalensis TaxID=1329262 RepID=A0A3N1X7J6_9FIRM|nr:endonuclease MutS2 [Mobilisporobacter senegalensis]ROR21938.1 DNA mismatch repair protein MutS2 [Mobilisporobacter senegalensis]